MSYAYVNVHLGGVLLSQLLDWLRWHFVEVDRLAREIMQEEPAHAHQQYWDTVSSLWRSFMLSDGKSSARHFFMFLDVLIVFAMIYVFLYLYCSWYVLCYKAV